MENGKHEIEQESDDDCEVYFLRPVNGYNIAEKIRDANKELFGDEIGNELELMIESQTNRKVSFAVNLEEYEPHSGISLKELEFRLGKDDVENNEKNILKTGNAQKLEIIAEEESITEIENNDHCQTPSKKTDFELEERSENIEICDKPEPSQFKACTSEEAEIVEEICEEILIMDLESETPEVAEAASNKTPGNSVQHKMLKQMTFDFTGDDDENDNKSLTNLLLISDHENDSNEDDENQEYNCNESLNDDTDCENEELLPLYNDNDEDDNLSIIVSSYLPDDTPLKLRTSPRYTKIRKRFSLRRKSKSSNAIGSCINHHMCSNGRFMPPPEVTDLKLHYKTCCAFKNAQQNLPNYSGYNSEYGLSKQQLIEREHKLQQKQQSKIVGNLKTLDNEVRKMHDNERAFTTWLKNKMRFPINKTRNMFDVKRPFGLRKCTSLGGNSLKDDAKQFLNTNNYRSISAKFKKAQF